MLRSAVQGDQILDSRISHLMVLIQVAPLVLVQALVQVQSDGTCTIGPIGPCTRWAMFKWPHDTPLMLNIAQYSPILPCHFARRHDTELPQNCVEPHIHSDRHSSSFRRREHVEP